MSIARLFASAAIAAVLGSAVTATAHADAVADFYKGKRIKILIGSGPGGGYDTYARMVARHLGGFIPGKPGFTAQNMMGAGSIIATNFMVNVAPRDGTVIGALQREIPLVQLLGQSGPKYKAAELNWLGSLASENGLCAIATRANVKSFEEVFQREIVFGGTGANTTEFHPALLNSLLGAKIKLIKGYPSTRPLHLVIQRGEVDGICQSWASFKELAGAFYTSGGIKPVVQMALKPDPEMSKMGVPMIMDYITPERVVKGRTVEEVKTFYRAILAGDVMGRPYAVAPGVPEDRVKALRAAFVAMSKDPAFIADAKKQRRDVELVTGEEIQKIISEIAAVPQAKLKELDELIKFRGPTAQAKVQMVRHTGKVVDVKRGGRAIVIDYQGKKAEASVSGSRTKVSIDGKSANRGGVKAGMTCTFVYTGPKSQAQEVICKN